MTDNENKYWAFLSYSRQDNCKKRSDTQAVSSLSWGNWLHDALMTFSIPADFVGQINGRGETIPERIGPIFREEPDQPEAASLSADSRKALAQSICLIVICSPRSAQSLQMNEAVRYFKELGRDNRILPIVVAGEPNASDGSKPGRSSADECFVPALRHPVQPDGTLDTTRRAGKSIFVDARHGVDKREILATDDRAAEADLEMAKIQLIALLIGVGFNGLWWREQKRHFFDFAEAQRQAREALNQVVEVQRQLQEARQQTREAQTKALETQNLPRDVHGQIQEAQNQVRETQNQLQEFQNKVRDTQSQLEEARNRALAAESKVLEAQHQAREAQNQLVETRNQVREAQNKVLEIQNRSQAVPNEIQAAQGQVQEFQNQAQSAQIQLEEARQQVREAQGKALEAQQQAREAQNKIQEIQSQTRDVQSQIQEAKNQALEAHDQARLAQTHVREIQNKNQAARRLTRVLALIAVLAALAATIAWWQRKLATQALAKAEVRQAALDAGALNREQIRQALQKAGGAAPEVKQFHSLDELAAQIPMGEISETLQAAALILNDPQRTHFQELLLDCWMKTNLPAAFDWSCQLTDAAFRQRALGKIIPALAADNLTNALARLNDLNPVPGEQSYTLLFQRWAAQDPIQAIEQRQQIPAHDAEAQILSAILAVWGDQQPAAALTWLESQPESEAVPAGTWRNSMIAGLFDGWAAKDLETATTACQQLPDSPAKEKAWECVLHQRIVKAPASAAEAIKNLPSGDFRQKAIVELCQHWFGTNGSAVLDWAQSLPLEAERMAVTNQVVVNWARKDPSAAAQFANQHPELSGAAFGEIASAWFQSDLTGTTNWVASLPDGEKKAAALLALVENWAQSDPKGMVTYALGLPAGDIQTRYLTTAGHQLARRDFPGTVELLQPLSDAALRQSILEQAARNCDRSHLNPVAKYIAAMPAGDDQRAAIKGLLSSWTAVDPETAVNWLISFPETNAQPETVQSVIRAWAQTEPAAVAKWLANLPAGVAGEDLVGAFLEGAIEKYPVFACQWTQSVTDETRRQKLQLQVARQWMKTNPSAASQWIDSLDLPPEIKQP